MKKETELDNSKKRRSKSRSKPGSKGIAYQNKDIISKILAEEFKDKSFAVYGVDLPKIVSAEPTNLPKVEAKELRMDNLFHLEDDSYLIVDYESKYRYSNMFKYLNYVVRTAKKLYNELKEIPRIRMLVIYTGDVMRKETISSMDAGCMKLELSEAFLSELDAEEIWSRISAKINCNQPIEPEEQMELIIYPLIFKKKEDKQDAITDVIQLVKEIDDEDIRTFIYKCLIVFTDKVIRESDAKEIKEALMLTKVEKLIYNDAQIDIAKNFLKSGSTVDYVAENTGLPIKKVKELYKSIKEQVKLAEG